MVTLAPPLLLLRLVSIGVRRPGKGDSYYNLDVTKKISPENADCCRADLLFVSTGVILPFVSELKFVGLDEDDLPRSSGAKPLLIVFPYRSSILLGFLL